MISVIEHRPDNWVILKIKNPTETFYKVLAGWSGGYLDGDSWRMNSGVESVDEIEYAYMFKGSSGSIYTCGKNSYGVRMTSAHVLDELLKKYPDNIELMPEDTNWMNMNWSEK
jgi:hypothetical protein